MTTLFMTNLVKTSDTLCELGSSLPGVGGECALALDEKLRK